MIEVEARIPDGIPQCPGGLGGPVFAPARAVMQEDEVKIRMRPRVTAAHTANGRKCQPMPRSHRIGEMLGEARVDEFRERGAAFIARRGPQRMRHLHSLTLEVPHPMGVRDLSG